MEQNQYHIYTKTFSKGSMIHQFNNQEANNLKSLIAMLSVAFDQVFYMDIIDTAFLSIMHMLHLRQIKFI